MLKEVINPTFPVTLQPTSTWSGNVPFVAVTLLGLGGASCAATIVEESPATVKRAAVKNIAKGRVEMVRIIQLIRLGEFECTSTNLGTRWTSSFFLRNLLSVG